jgi:Zn-dependent protease with chaperone function
LKRNHLALFVFLSQGIGAIFFAVFLAAYALALPSNQGLHGQPIFRIPLSIFGGLFLALTAIAVVLSFIVKPED